MNELVVSVSSRSSSLRKAFLYLSSPRNNCCRQLHVADVFAELGAIQGIDENGNDVQVLLRLIAAYKGSMITEVFVFLPHYSAAFNVDSMIH